MATFQELIDRASKSLMTIPTAEAADRCQSAQKRGWGRGTWGYSSDGECLVTYVNKATPSVHHLHTSPVDDITWCCLCEDPEGLKKTKALLYDIELTAEGLI